MELQIITYDTYQHAPSPLDKEFVTFNTKPIPNYFQTLKTVPVIRIYGTVPETHTSALIHIHNVFPYLYIIFPKACKWSNSLTGSQILELRKWLDEINSKMNESFRRTVTSKKRKKKETHTNNKKQNYDDYAAEDEDDFDPVDNEEGEYSLKTCYISDLSIISGTPFYGFHDLSTTFLKISMASSKYVTRLSKLLTDGNIFGRFIQPYESHVPYILQFLTDYNCCTLKTLKLNEFMWRSPIIFSESAPELYQSNFETNFPAFNKSKISAELLKFINSHVHEYNKWINILTPDAFPRIGRTMLELDVLSAWIENIKELAERKVARLSTGEDMNTDITYISSTRSLLDDVENLRKSRGLKADSSQFSLFDKLKRNSKISWADQDQLEQQLRAAINLSEVTFKQKYMHSDFSLLRKEVKAIHFPTSFQHIKLLQYVPQLKDNILAKLKTITPDLVEILAKSQPSVVEPDFEDMSSDENGDDFLDKVDKLSENFLSDIAADNKRNEVLSSPNTSTNLTLKLRDALIQVDADLNTSNILDHSKNSFLKKSITLSQRMSALVIPFNSYFDKNKNNSIYTFNVQQPIAKSKDDFLNSMEEYGLPKINYPDPFFSNLSNFDSKPFIFAGDKFQLKCSEIDKNPYPSCPQLNLVAPITEDQIIWKYTPKMPKYAEVKEWLPKKDTKKSSYSFKSQIAGPTQNFKEYKYNSLQTPIENISGNENTMIVLIIEIHVNTRGKLMPDPKEDEIAAVFYKSNFSKFFPHSKIPDKGVFLNKIKYKDATTFESELDLLIGLVSLVEYIDPDICVGFELHASSWGYIIERTENKYHIDLVKRFSRVAYKHNNKVGDRYGYTHASGIRITGRQMLNLWRRLRKELTLNHYTLENVVFHIFHQRIPHFAPKVLTCWWNADKLSLVLDYHTSRIQYEMDLIEKLELIEKVNEQSRLLGIDFYSILYRGSQFMVECLLVRLTKAENFILISPSKKQVFKQDSLECIPLVMEPASAFYKSPIVVLDFQSLYPSLIIAYNICFSTLLGRLKNYDPKKYTKLGVTTYKSPEGILKLLEKDMIVTPNGMLFAKQNIRKSLLAKMLTEILNARLYIKGTMSDFKDDEELTKLYNKRQMALKMIANVTYGYTAATYSGRMSNSDIADAIVSCARETLLKAVKHIESVQKWGAKVVYGDTDSLFVYLPGKSKEDAFTIGREIAKQITTINPAPVTLKFEKVYLPSILVSKKRYIGWKYEWEGQKLPEFDAKGIETVRRDGIPAQQKILQKSISLLFETRDVSLIKTYVVEQLIKIATNSVNVKDFMFAKEVRVGTYKNEAYIPPGARLSIKRARDDHRLEPQYKERVFYLVRKPNNSKEILRDKCVSPGEFLQQGLELDSEYYINKVIMPPLERVFNLLGVDVRAWVKEMPQKLSYSGINDKLSNVNVQKCLVCGNFSGSCSNLCVSCKKNELETIIMLKGKVKEHEKKAQEFVDFCSACIYSALKEPVRVDAVNQCCNEDCSVYFRRVKTLRKVDSVLKDYNTIPDW